MKKALSMLLVLAMLIGMMPMQAFATDGTQETEAVEVVTELSEASEEETEPSEEEEIEESSNEDEETNPSEEEESEEPSELSESEEEPEVVHEHNYETVVTDPSCTEQGYTTYTCECGDSYVADLLDAAGHPYKSGICTDCGAEHPNLANYKGKVISIMGDSISSFKGYIPVADGFNEEHPSAYPVRDVQSWDQTWWGLVINSLDAKLGINDSWSGSRVHNYSTADNPGGGIGVKVCMSSTTRVSNLGANGTPDIILVYGGTNDGKFSPFGGFDPSLDYSQVDLDAVTWKTFEDAYVAMIMRMQHYYPEARIIALLPTPVASWYTDEKLATMNSSIKEICDYFGIDYVDLPECGITLADLPDGLHPNAAGMSYIADAVLEVLLNTNEEAGENIVYPITHNLNGAKASKGYYKGVSGNRRFEETLTGETGCVSVTMNGVDITDSCYENGTISIQSVNGDIVVTEKEHNYSKIVTDPTCTEQGYTTYTCAVCSNSYVVDYVKALGHIYENNICTGCGEDKSLHVHNYETVVTPPTCTEKGYTTYSCACGDVYKDDYVDANGHSYKRITCTTCGETHPNAENYEGKVISIMGDSISSFKGYIPVADGFNEEHLPAYPAHDVQSWDKTWWGLVINELDAKLGINDSSSGSRVHNYTTADNPGGGIGAKICMSSTTRISNLGANGTPDVILVYGGTNDGRLSPFGSFDPTQDYSQVDLDVVTWKNFEDAYVAMIQRMQHYYPEARIIALLPTRTSSVWYSDEKLAAMNSSIKEICDYFGIDYVDLPECGITLADLPDGVHPNAAGMSYIADAVLEVLLNVPEEAGENIVHSITHNLNGATASKGYYKGVSNNKRFEETLTGELACISVTMNGVDITDSCYKNGTICIQSVTGDVVITAKEHSYNKIVTDPTCTEKGYTTYTCAVCSYSYVDDYSNVNAENHTYKNGICTGCGEKLSFEGKTISILGDSISTYIGVSNDASVNATLKGGAIYYNAGTQGVYRADTWWQQTIDVLGMELLVNNSWSGSTVLHTRSGTAGAYVNRCVQLHNTAGDEPDVIVVFLGTNDFSYYQNALGTANIDYAKLITDNGDGTYTYATPKTTCEAYAVMLHKMINRYPDAEVYCMNLLPRRNPDHDGKDVVPAPTQFNGELAKVISHFGCTVVDLENCGITPAPENFDIYITDQRVHPGPLGMDQMTQTLIDAMMGMEDATFAVSQNLVNVTANVSGGIVLSGESFNVALTPAAGFDKLTVTVTMGGKDVTASVYSNGKVNIPAVTGDVVITASATVDDTPNNYCWEISGNNFVNVVKNDLSANTLTKKTGSITDGVIKSAYFQLEKPVVLRHNRPWIVEWRVSGTSWSGMLLSGNVNSSAAGNSYLFKTTQNTGFIGFGELVSGSYHNYGIALASQGVDLAAEHTYRLENHIAADGSNMAYLLVDGKDYGPMNHYYIGGNSNQGKQVDWLNGRDFCFFYIGSNGHPLNNCKLDYLTVTACVHTYENGICTSCGSVSEETVVNGTCGENLTWTLDKDGVLTISGTGEMFDYGYRAEEGFVVNPPWNKYKNEIITVVIEDGITNIGRMAFEGCVNLTGIELSKDLTAIGTNAFSNCSALANVRLPETVTSMGNFAFSGCKSLTSMEIPAGVTTIGSHAFSNCSALVTVKLPTGITQISDRMFNGCAALASIEIPTGVTGIGNYAFFGCKGLETVELPNGLVSIGEYAFGNCAALTGITLPESLVSIGNSAFSACSSLTGIVIPDAVTELGNSVFYNCYNLKNVELPADITSIGEWVFYGCGLTSIDLPDSVTHINDYAFYSCDYLTSIEIPQSVVRIGVHAFCDCIRLTSIKLPDGLESIGNGAFERCKSLDKITFTGDAPSIAESAFANVTATVYYPSNNATWTANARQDYGASALTWTSYCDHTYENGICTGCGKKLSFEGKTISILGDSISTFAGISDDGTVNATLSGSTVYYGQGSLGGYRNTWWQQTIDTLGMELLVNNSWSGTCVLKTRGTVGAYIDRCVQLHNDRTGEQPDVIAVFMGTNDYSYYQSTLGTAEIDYAALITDRGDGTFDYAKPTTTCEAYAIMLHKMTQRYPDAEIYCLGMLSRRDPYHDGREVVPPPTSFNAELKAIVERFGATYVDVESFIPATASEFDQYMSDRRVHPNAAGMDKITEAVVETMLQQQVTLRNVSYDLHNVSCSKEPAAVIENEPFELTLTATDNGLDLAVRVTMGGEDITSQCYANGKVSIAKITGNIVITAIVLHRPSDYLWQFDNGELVSAGTNANQLTKLAGSTQDNVFRETRYQLAVTAELIHTRPWVVEWAGEGKGGFMLSQASSSTGAPFFIRRSGNYLTAFGHYNNDHYDNYGLTLDAANINGAAKHVYRLENRIAQNGNNMVWLLVDGIEIGALNNYYIAGTSQGSTADWISGKDFHINYIGSSSHPLSGYALEYISITECAHIFSNGICIGCGATQPGPVITQQPESVQQEVGKKFAVTVKAEGEGLTYQWYVKENGAKAFKVSSNKTASYAYTMQTYMHNRQVYCVITDANGDSVQTETATITRPPVALTIIEQPKDAQANIGEKFSISPKVEGDGLTYQWYVKEAGAKAFKVSSNKTSAYAYTMQSYMKGRQVYCVITDKYGNSVTTDVATISLPPVELKILEQPSDVYAVKGEKFSISFVVQGDGLTYQWYYKESYMKDFKPSSNKTSAYAYSMQNYMDGRSVYCVITDLYGNQITTEIVTIDECDGIYYLTESAEGTYTIYTLAKDGSHKYEMNFTGTMNSNTNTITVTKVTSYPAEGVIIPALTTYTADKAVYAVSINPASPFADLGTMSASVSIIPVDGKKVGLTSTVLSNMFKRNNGTNFVSLDLSGLDTSNVTTMSYMFNGCSSLTELDLSGFDTANVTNMSTMFNGCSGLTELDVSGFDTVNVTNMYYMFGSCSGLTELDLSGFDTANVTNMANMFRGCSSLTELAVSGFDTAKVTNMSWMFSGCKNLYDLDFTNWDMSKANTANMFYNCPAGA